MTLTTKIDHPFGADYANSVGTSSGTQDSWVETLRQTSRAVLESQGMPNRKMEAWKYTSLTELAKTAFIPAALADDVDVASIPITIPQVPGAQRFVCVNGIFRADLSDDVAEIEQGCVVQSLAHVFAQPSSSLKKSIGTVSHPECSPVTTLNTSFVEDGLSIDVKDGVVVENPIHIISIGASGAHPGSFHPRNVIRLAPASQATVIETHTGLPGQPYLTNPVTEVVIEPDARLNHFIIASDDSHGSHLGRNDVRVNRRGHYDSFVLSMGGALTRREIRVELKEQDAQAKVDGAYGVHGAQHSDIYSEIYHLAPGTVSRQTIKGVLAGTSQGIFQGRIHVAREAQGTDGRQLHKALLLNPGPEVDCKPELEIFADDVQCAHGAATGELDTDHIFYLMSRGIDEQTARALLIEGFLDDVVLNITHPDSQRLILDTVKSWLAAHAQHTGASA